MANDKEQRRHEGCGADALKRGRAAVIFNEDALWHAVTPLGAREERIVRTMQYVTDQEMGPFHRAFSNLKDAFAYFGPAALIHRPNAEWVSNSPAALRLIRLAEAVGMDAQTVLHVQRGCDCAPALGDEKQGAQTLQSTQRDSIAPSCPRFKINTVQ